MQELHPSISCFPKRKRLLAVDCGVLRVLHDCGVAFDTVKGNLQCRFETDMQGIYLPPILSLGMVIVSLSLEMYPRDSIVDAYPLLSIKLRSAGSSFSRSSRWWRTESESTDIGGGDLCSIQRY